MVYDQTDSLYLCFDQLDISLKRMDQNQFREALYLKTQFIDSKFGFTILGTFPYNKTTLLSVCFWKSNICLSVNNYFNLFTDFLFCIKLFVYISTKWKK